MRFTLNLERSKTDLRDFKLEIKSPILSTPGYVNLESFLPPVYDQGMIGSCTAQSVACMYATLFKNIAKTGFNPARLFIYFNTRKIQNTIGYDSGASLRDTMKAIRRYGACPETMWPYINTTLFTPPNSSCYVEGEKRQAVSYASVPLKLSLMKQLLGQKYVFVIGLLIYESFFSGTVSVPVPKTNQEQLLGGHAVCVFGYDDRRNAFLVRNSWGRSWGSGGNFYLPYSYATNPNLAFDAWVLYTIEIPKFGIKKNFRK